MFIVVFLFLVAEVEERVRERQRDRHTQRGRKIRIYSKEAGRGRQVR